MTLVLIKVSQEQNEFTNKAIKLLTADAICQQLLNFR
jgi:hypothetical protein